MTDRTVLVTGATGNQGGSVADALLNRGMRVRALVRDPKSPKAVALASRGVTLVQGDLDEAPTIERAAEGVDSVFVITTPFTPGVGTDGEIRQGRVIIDALTRVQPPHVVYSSVSDADKRTGIPHFESKADAERVLADSGLPVTITAPVFFSENVLFPSNLADIKNGVFRQALPVDRKLQFVSLREIGAFNASVIDRGPVLAGKRYNYGGDEVTPAEVVEILGRVTGRDLRYEEAPIDAIRAMSEDVALMYEWFDKVGYSADLEALRRDFPEVEWMSFAQWASAQDWKQLLA